MSTELNPAWGPHIKSRVNLHNAMFDVVLAMLPVIAAAVYYFGQQVLLLALVCAGTAVLIEMAATLLRKGKPTLPDGSAVVTGLLIALLLPANSYWWVGILGVIIGMGVGRELSGGLAKNRFNPALVGRVSLTAMTWVIPGFNLVPVDAVSGATPLARLLAGEALGTYGQVILGGPAGSIAETSPLLIVIGGLYLLYRRHINWRTPLTIITICGFAAMALGYDPVLYVAAGGILTGAFLMATDWVTSPITPRGKVLAGALIGLLIVTFRALPFTTEGVAYAILISNALTPFINQFTRLRTFGHLPHRGS